MEWLLHRKQSDKLLGAVHKGGVASSSPFLLFRLPSELLSHNCPYSCKPAPGTIGMALPVGSKPSWACLCRSPTLVVKAWCRETLSLQLKPSWHCGIHSDFAMDSPFLVENFETCFSPWHVPIGQWEEAWDNPPRRCHGLYLFQSGPSGGDSGWKRILSPNPHLEPAPTYYLQPCFQRQCVQVGALSLWVHTHIHWCPFETPYVSPQA